MISLESLLFRPSLLYRDVSSVPKVPSLVLSSFWSAEGLRGKIGPERTTLDPPLFKRISTTLQIVYVQRNVTLVPFPRERDLEEEPNPYLHESR